MVRRIQSILVVQYHSIQNCKEDWNNKRCVLSISIADDSIITITKTITNGKIKKETTKQDTKLQNRTEHG